MFTFYQLIDITAIWKGYVIMLRSGDFNGISKHNNEWVMGPASHASDSMH